MNILFWYIGITYYCTLVSAQTYYPVVQQLPWKPIQRQNCYNNNYNQAWRPVYNQGWNNVRSSTLNGHELVSLYFATKTKEPEEPTTTLGTTTSTTSTTTLGTTKTTLGTTPTTTSTTTLGTKKTTLGTTTTTTSTTTLGTTKTTLGTTPTTISTTTLRTTKTTLRTTPTTTSTTTLGTTKTTLGTHELVSYTVQSTEKPEHLDTKPTTLPSPENKDTNLAKKSEAAKKKTKWFGPDEHSPFLHEHKNKNKYTSKHSYDSFSPSSESCSSEDSSADVIIDSYYDDKPLSTKESPKKTKTTTKPQNLETTTEPQALETIKEPRDLETTTEVHDVETTREPQALETTTEPQALETTTKPQALDTTTEPQVLETTTVPRNLETSSVLLSSEKNAEETTEAPNYPVVNANCTQGANGTSTNCYIERNSSAACINPLLWNCYPKLGKGLAVNIKVQLA